MIENKPITNNVLLMGYDSFQIVELIKEVDKLKEDKGFLVYEGNSVKDAYKKAREFVQNLGLEAHITKDGKWITRQIELDENTSIIDFGSHTLFLMRKVKHK